MATYSKNSDAVIFDMISLTQSETKRTSHCWLLLKNPENLNAYAIETFFLVSVRQNKGEGDGLALREKGLCTPLEEAERYFHNLLEGKLTAAMLPALIGHLEKTADLPIEAGLIQERNLFSRQFLSEAPLLGLTGFLEKRAKRFRLDSKTRESIRDLLDWMRLPVDNNPR